MEYGSEASELVIHEYLRVLRRRKLVVLVAVVAAMAIAVGYSRSRPKIYESSAEVLLQHRSTDSLFDALKDVGDPSRLPETEMKVIQSQPVRAAVEKELGPGSTVTTSQAGSADVIAVKVRSTDPVMAARTANAYAKAYIDFRRTRTVDDILAATTQIQAKVDELQPQINALDDEIRSAAPKGSPTALEVLAARSQSLSNQQNAFKQTLNQLQVGSAINTGGAEIVNPAFPSQRPVSPRPVSTGLLAGTAGLLLGVGAAFLLEYLDDSIKTKEHLERAIGTSIPIFGLIPPIGRSDRSGSGEASLVSPTSRAAEAYLALRTSVQFQSVDRPIVLQVTSASLSEGKTTTVANLAGVFARAGKRVFLVDCDLRRPHVHDFWDLSNETGFTSVLVGASRLSDSLEKVSEQSELYVLPSGPRPPNPSELLSSQEAGELLSKMKATSDIVLVDSPPLLPVTDASVLARKVDALLLVVMAGTTKRRALQRAVELLRQMKAPVVGVVLTRAGGESDYGSQYAYRASESPGRGAGRDEQKADGRAGSSERIVS